MKSIKEFVDYVDDQLFFGEEMEGGEAISHYLNLCECIESDAGEYSPYLLGPVRILTMHLELARRYDDAVIWAIKYKTIIKINMYLDELPELSSDLLIARLMRLRGDVVVGEGAMKSARDRVRALTQGP